MNKLATNAISNITKRFIQAICNKQPNGATSSRPGITQQDTLRVWWIHSRALCHRYHVCIMVHITLDSGLQNPDAWWIPRTQHVCHEGMWDGGERTFKVVTRGGCRPPAPPRLPAPCHNCLVHHTAGNSDTGITAVVHGYAT